MQHGWNGTTACECLQHRKLSENYEHCIKHSLWVRQGLQVNCLYNNLVTCTRNSAVQRLLRTSGKRERERPTERIKNSILFSPPPISAPIPSIGVAASCRVTAGLHKFDTQNSRVRFLSNIKDVWGLSFQENTGSLECFRIGPCFIEGRTQESSSGVAELSGAKTPPTSYFFSIFLTPVSVLDPELLR